MDENKKYQKEFINLVWSVYKTQFKEARKWKSGGLTLGEVLYAELNNIRLGINHLVALKNFYEPVPRVDTLTIAYKFELRRWVKRNLCFVSPTHFYYIGDSAINYPPVSSLTNTKNKNSYNYNDKRFTLDHSHTHTKVS